VNGGEIVVAGTPETVAETAASFTGQYLRPLLERAAVKPEVVVSKPHRSPRAKSRSVPADEADLIGAK
jgi:excinuclease ABC subunit A